MKAGEARSKGSLVIDLTQRASKPARQLAPGKLISARSSADAYGVIRCRCLEALAASPGHEGLLP